MKKVVMTNTTSRNPSMDILRIAACMGVVLLHVFVSAFGKGYLVAGKTEWVLCFLISHSLYWTVPIFAMITGYFFLNPRKELSLNKLYGKYILRMVLSVVFWTLLYALLLHHPYYPFTGWWTNFWYVGVCIGLYISMPVLRSIAADERLLSYSCWIWLLCRVYFNLGLFFTMPFKITDHVFTEYVGNCLWGYYLSRMKLSRNQTRAIYIIGILFLVVTVALGFVTEGETRNNITLLDPFFVCAAIFLFVMKHPIQLSDKTCGIVTSVSKMTFGIYLVHTMVLNRTYHVIHHFIPNMFIFIPVSFFATFMMCFVIILIIKQIPILKKWVV